MSLDIARLIAFSGLSATQVQISVTSSNISNADTTGYTTKTANQTSSVTNGVGTGVTVDRHHLDGGQAAPEVADRRNL
ncbi:flagellar hook protein FlgE [Bradyrhizobium diazoefficiens]